jgi:signal transduction histidine kinase
MLNRLNLVRAAPVRDAIAFAVISALAMGVLFAVIYWSMISMLQQNLEDAIDDQLQTLRHDFKRDGREAMIGFVQQRLKEPGAKPKHLMHFLVQDKAGRLLAGNFPPLNPSEGWQDIVLLGISGLESDQEHVFRAKGAQFDEDTFVLIAHTTGDLILARGRILLSFTLALALMVTLTLGGGIIIGRALHRRVEAAISAAQAIMEGDLSRRIPVEGSGDEIDLLAEGLNRMLSRIDELMANLRFITSDIAHDLRTPLGRLRQRLSALQVKESTPADYQAAINAAIEDTDILLRTFDAMLRIAQIEAGSARTRFTGVDLSHVAENVAEAFTAVSEDHGRRFVAQIQPDVSVQGDPHLLTQMLANLIENALRHTPVGTTLSVGLRDETTGPCLTVADDGPGIPHEERERVMGRFYRLDKSRSMPGSGLGLSLVAAIAKLHEAIVTLEDNGPGLRATVQFSKEPGHR